MDKAYYLYRPHNHLGNFYPGKVLNLLTDTRSFGRYLPDLMQIKLARKYFPDGLSPHGLSALLSPEMADKEFMEPITELIFELVRQLHFPQAPSRLTSCYASESIADSEKWYNILHENFGHQHGQAAQSLWEIQYETEAKSYDAGFLEIMAGDRFSYITALENAHNYWSGNLTKDPLPELLIPYPVTVFRCLRDYYPM